MRVVFHPEFSPDLRRFEAQYSQVSDGLALRFRDEVLQAIAAIKRDVTSRCRSFPYHRGSAIGRPAKEPSLIPILLALRLHGRGTVLRFDRSQPVIPFDLAFSISNGATARTATEELTLTYTSTPP